MSQTKALKIGLLETGRPPEELQNFADYPTKFERLLRGADDNLSFQRWAVLDDDIPDDVHACDAWLITGSRFGAYEDHSWIEPLMAFIRKTHQANVPLIGICFGHQIIAQALGGKVEKSDKGWGVSVHSYELLDNNDKPKWLESDKDSFDIQCFHQDQVVQLPATADVLASSDFCPYAMLSYGNQALTFQGHPEFSGDYGQALIDVRRDLLGNEVSEAGEKVVRQAIDSATVAKWIVNFIRQR